MTGQSPSDTLVTITPSSPLVRLPRCPSRLTFELTISHRRTPCHIHTQSPTVRLAELPSLKIDEDGTFATEPTTVGANQNAGKPNTTPRSAPSSTDSGDKKASPSPGVEDFNANHPFLLAVRHNRSGVFLFSGRIMSP
ncbi:hypothetical protein BV898_11687 [Hypsibius exemplaris]|uniref:Serpin domain-containing protein n=1 Tax=Hypsibius exemplaris TaxID=2072580 RepID=A0A1W0WG03_HYPEX|nr:hypothetical protein BV898_11687 [Hypsibius exemplaris]